MKKHTFFFVFMISIFYVSYAQSSNYIEVVYLKNKSKIHGIIIENIPNKSIKIETLSGDVFVFSIDEIDKITKEKPKDQKDYTIHINDKESRYFSKNSLYVGGEIYLLKTSTTSNSVNQFIFGPNLGIFVTENLLLAALIRYETINKLESFSIGPILRYYFGSTDNKFFTSLALELYEDNFTNAYSIGFGLGYHIKITKNIGLSPLFQFSAITPDNGNFADLKQYYFGLSIDSFIF